MNSCIINTLCLAFWVPSRAIHIIRCYLQPGLFILLIEWKDWMIDWFCRRSCWRACRSGWISILRINLRTLVLCAFCTTECGSPGILKSTSASLAISNLWLTSWSATDLSVLVRSISSPTYRFQETVAPLPWRHHLALHVDCLMPWTPIQLFSVDNSSKVCACGSDTKMWNRQRNHTLQRRSMMRLSFQRDRTRLATHCEPSAGSLECNIGCPGCDGRGYNTTGTRTVNSLHLDNGCFLLKPMMVVPSQLSAMASLELDFEMDWPPSPLPTCSGNARVCKTHNHFSLIHRMSRHGGFCYHQIWILTFRRQKTLNRANHDDAHSRANELSVAYLGSSKTTNDGPCCCSTSKIGASDLPHDQFNERWYKWFVGSFELSCQRRLSIGCQFGNDSTTMRVSPSAMWPGDHCSLQCLFCSTNQDAECEPSPQRIVLLSRLLHLSPCCSQMKGAVLRLSTIRMRRAQLRWVRAPKLLGWSLWDVRRKKNLYFLYFQEH